MPHRSRTIDEQIGNHILMRRKAKGITQKQLGDAIGVTFQQIQKYEKGLDRVTASRLIEIARGLDTSPLRLLPPDNPDEDDKDKLLSLLDGPEAVRMASAYRKVCPKYRRLLLEMVELCAVRMYPSCDD